ncbi:MAG: gamma-glutamyltransferase, partial [Rhodospirillales bacterium]
MKDRLENRPRKRLIPVFLAMAGVLAVAACQHEKAGGPTLTGPVQAQSGPGQTGPAKGYRHMVAAGHPLAAEAGRDILRRGGNAIDAAIAAQMVLGLVQPQSSGIGGGAFLMHYAAKTGAIDAYDGRETAPKSAHAYMFLDGTG